MTRQETGKRPMGGEEQRVLGLAAALNAAYGALDTRGAARPADGSSVHGLRRCPECGLPAAPDNRSRCSCDLVGRLLIQFVAGVREDGRYRRDYQGYRELDGISLFWDNASIRRQVDDFEVVPSAYELDLRFQRFLTGDEIARVETTLADNLSPAFVEVEREQSEDDDGTCFHATVRYLDGP